MGGWAAGGYSTKRGWSSGLTDMTNDLSPTIQHFPGGDPVEWIGCAWPCRRASAFKGIKFPIRCRLRAAGCATSPGENDDRVTCSLSECRESEGLLHGRFFVRGLRRNTAVASHMFGEIKTSMATMAATVPRTCFPPGGMPGGRCLHAVHLIQDRSGIDAGEVVIIPSPGVFCSRAGTPDFWPFAARVWPAKARDNGVFLTATYQQPRHAL